MKLAKEGRIAMSIKKIDFGNEAWKKESLVNAYYFFKGAETPEFTQQEGSVATFSATKFTINEISGNQRNRRRQYRKD